jgi:hypothetical protein
MADTGPKRSEFQREQDYVEIAERYLRGESQASIAEHLNVTQQQVSQDLKVIQKRWQKAVVAKIDTAKAKELAKIDLLEQTYWNAWFDSKSPKKSSSTEVFDLAELLSDGGQVKKHKTTEKTEQRDGNPAFLQGIQSCIERRCKILGIDAPIKHADADGGNLPDSKTIIIIGDSELDYDSTEDQSNAIQPDLS